MFGLLENENPDAVELLKQDHDDVEEMFEEFQDAKEDENDEMKAALVMSICRALTIHAQIEEEIFYPAMRTLEFDDARELADEAAVEHATIRDLVSQLRSMRPGDDLFDAKVRVLAEYVKHHVREEESELFPDAKDSGLDLVALGRKIQMRKAHLEETRDASPVRKQASAARRRALVSSRTRSTSRTTATK